MSFGDLIGKLQSVVSSFGTEQTKKTGKKEEVSENSLFSSMLEKINEESDVTGIEIDYSQAADEVAEQLFINKEIHRNAEDAKEWTERVTQELEEANIPASLKDELAPLYGQLCDAIDENQREYITAKIQQKYLEAEANGADGSNFKTLDLDLQIFSSLSLQGKMISELNEKLAEANDYKTRNKIDAEIEKAYADFDIEQSKLYMESYIRENGLSDEQVDGLSELYSQLNEATDENSRAILNAKLDKFCIEQGIDRNSEMMLVLDNNASEIAYDSKLSDLYKQMMHASSDKQIDMIGRKINLVSTEQAVKRSEFQQKISISNMDIDEETKEEVFALLDDLSSVSARGEFDIINAEIAYSLAQAGVDLNGRDYTLFQLETTGLQMEKEYLALHQEALETTDPKKIDEINNKLESIYDSYEPQFDRIHNKLNDIDNKKDAERLSEMYEELSNTTNPEQRKNISEQIKRMIDEQNKTLLENEILDSYWDLYEATDEVEKETIISQIKALHSEYSDMKLEEKLSNLYDDLSKTNDIASRDTIKAKIKEVENQINKKAELESLYEQLAECSSVGEREKILAKIKELE